MAAEVPTNGRARLEEFLAQTEESSSPGDERRAEIQLMSSKTFAEAKYEQRWLVRRILVEGQPAVFGGPRKGLKTSTLVDLAVSLASKRTVVGEDWRSGSARKVTKFLGHFEVARHVRVGLFSGESGEATLQDTAHRICRAKGRSLDQLEIYWGFRLPRLSDLLDLEHLQGLIREHELEVVILDPLYLSLTAGNSSLDAQNLYDVGPVLANMARACLTAGATPILCHHSRKYRPSDERYEPLELEDLAYAGIAEFARQWVLLSRRQKYTPGTHRLWLSAGGSAGHGGLWGLDVDEGCLDDNFGGRRWSTRVLTLDEIKQEAQERAQEERKRRQEAGLEPMGKRILHHLRDHPGGQTENVLSNQLGMNKRTLKDALRHLVVKRVIEPCSVKQANGQSYTGYKRVAAGGDDG